MSKRYLSRRKFLTTVTAGAGTLLLGRSLMAMPLVSSGLAAETLPIVRLGKTGLKTTLLGMGTGFSGYNRTSSITRAGVAEPMIRQAYQKGIRFFDCADLYGTHEFTHDALKGYDRDSYLLATKIWVDPGGIPEAERPDANIVVERFRKELKTDYLDLVQIHCMTDAKWTDTQKKQMDLLENLKAKKIIRAHGVSVHSLDAMDHKDPARVTPVIEKLHKAGKGVIGMKLIGNGNFKDQSDKIDESLRFVLKLGTVDMIIVGFETPGQIDDYIGRIGRVLKNS